MNALYSSSRAELGLTSRNSIINRAMTDASVQRCDVFPNLINVALEKQRSDANAVFQPIASALTAPTLRYLLSDNFKACCQPMFCLVHVAGGIWLNFARPASLPFQGIEEGTVYVYYASETRFPNGEHTWRIRTLKQRAGIAFDIANRSAAAIRNKRSSSSMRR